MNNLAKHCSLWLLKLGDKRTVVCYTILSTFYMFKILYNRTYLQDIYKAQKI